jgi:hypothetical protein
VTGAPVLLLIFNRPDTTALVMETIRAARPSRLYVAADGPRDRPGEAERCEEARRISTAVDWPCEVRTLFRDHNLGCREAVSGAITWFFEHEAEGIILEDDCLAAPSFFEFCDVLLERFRDDERVMCITGNNFQPDMGRYPSGYYFSKYTHVWGWASWRRAWRLYDAQMERYSDFNRASTLEAMSLSEGFSNYWRNCFDSVYTRRLDTWDYVWGFSCWAQNGLTATPRANLVSNIGFGADATHTTDPNDAFARMATRSLDFPLDHPLLLAPHQGFDAVVDRVVYGIGQQANSIGIRSLPRRASRKICRSVNRRFRRFGAHTSIV